MMSYPSVVTGLMAHPLLTACLFSLLVFLGCIAPLITHKREKASVRRHRRYQAAAEGVMQKIATLAGDGQRMNYLRKINPYVFEELLLHAFENQGMAVTRNSSYSHDGGTDGQVLINGERWLIQAKRYSRSVSPAHVREFDALLNARNCRGFFIHTGRTGKMSREVCQYSSRMCMVSGQRLLSLLSGHSGWCPSFSGQASGADLSRKQDEKGTFYVS